MVFLDKLSILLYLSLMNPLDVVLIVQFYFASPLKDKYFDEDAADVDKKEEDAAKKKANRPSK